jgi:molecular chaperone GrpE (heat shock protein)
MDNCFKRFNIV